MSCFALFLSEDEIPKKIKDIKDSRQDITVYRIESAPRVIAWIGSEVLLFDTDNDKVEYTMCGRTFDYAFISSTSFTTMSSEWRQEILYRTVKKSRISLICEKERD